MEVPSTFSPYTSSSHCIKATPFISDFCRDKFYFTAIYSANTAMAKLVAVAVCLAILATTAHGERAFALK
jgi:hypothetical protein